MYIVTCKRYNFNVVGNFDYRIQIGTEVRVFDENNMFSKKRNNLSADLYVVVEELNHKYKLQNTRTKEIIIKTRFDIRPKN